MAVTIIKNCVIGCDVNGADYNVNAGAPATNFEIYYDLKGRKTTACWYTPIDNIKDLTNWHTINLSYDNSKSGSPFTLQLAADSKAELRILIYADLEGKSE